MTRKKAHGSLKLDNDDVLPSLNNDCTEIPSCSSKDIPSEVTESLFQVYSDIAQTFAKMTSAWLSEPDQLLKAQEGFCKNYINLCSSFVLRALNSESEAQPVTSMTVQDQRFLDPAWTEYPYFDFIKQSYLMTSQWAELLSDNVESVDEFTLLKAKFYIRQITTALSPSNFLPTNPELLRETFESKGENLARGIQMFTEDLETTTGFLNIRRTDQNAFTVGKNLAITPGKVIYENEIIQLIQYEPMTDSVFKRPLLIVPPWINKFYILDLTEDKSFIRWCVAQGHTVFVISWVNPYRELAKKSFSDYALEGIIDAVNIIEWSTGETEINAIGYCIGGTLLAATLAYMSTVNDRRIKSATFLTTQVDFTHAGDLKVFLNKDKLTVIEDDMQRLGFLDGHKMMMIFNMLRSKELIWPYIINNYVKGKAPAPFDVMFWNADVTHIPAANHSFYLRECYLKNSLAMGEMILCDVQINLQQVEIPIYNLAAKSDHIAPAKSVFVGNKLFGGDVDYVLTGSGHISGVINPPASKKYQYWRDGFTDGTYADWFASAQKHEGSWWTDWQAWVERQNDEKISPARSIGGNGIESLEDAPGSYVQVRYSRHPDNDQDDSFQDGVEIKTHVVA